MKRFFIVLFAVSLCYIGLFAENLNVDPQREDTYLQQEQTDDIQFNEDKNLQQEAVQGFQEDRNLEQEQTHDIQFEEDQNLQQEKELER